MRTKLLLTFCAFLALPVFSQENYELRGTSAYYEYDKSFITPELRGKHAITIGGQNAFSTPFSENLKTDAYGNQNMNWNLGFHVGYNYLILKERRRLLSATGKKATEIKNGFGIHYSMQFQNWQDNSTPDSSEVLKKEVFFTFSYYRPLIKLYIPIFRLYLFNEFGLGFHYNSRFRNTETRAFSPIATVEAIRIRLFNSAIYFHGTTSWAFGNNSLGTIPLDVSILAGMKIYFYKYN